MPARLYYGVACLSACLPACLSACLSACPSQPGSRTCLYTPVSNRGRRSSVVCVRCISERIRYSRVTFLSRLDYRATKLFFFSFFHDVSRRTKRRQIRTSAKGRKRRRRYETDGALTSVRAGYSRVFLLTYTRMNTAGGISFLAGDVYRARNPRSPSTADPLHSTRRHRPTTERSRIRGIFTGELLANAVRVSIR